GARPGLRRLSIAPRNDPKTVGTPWFSGILESGPAFFGDRSQADGGSPENKSRAAPPGEPTDGAALGRDTAQTVSSVVGCVVRSVRATSRSSATVRRGITFVAAGSTPSLVPIRSWAWQAWWGPESEEAVVMEWAAESRFPGSGLAGVGPGWSLVGAWPLLR